jgi:hypothetical protein
MLVPMPMLMFDLKSAGSMTFSRSMPVQRSVRKSSKNLPPGHGNDWGRGAMPLVEESPGEAVVALPEMPDVGAAPGAFEPELQPSAETQQVEEPEPQPSTETHRVELIIDSLPRHELIEAIPVTVDSLGDQVFTATVHALDLTGTGNSLGDALIIVKEQIEILYEKLSRAIELDNDEKRYLTFLQSHIKNTQSDNPRHSKRSFWR